MTQGMVRPLSRKEEFEISALLALFAAGLFALGVGVGFAIVAAVSS